MINDTKTIDALELVETETARHPVPATQPEHAVALPEATPMGMMLSAMRQGATLADVREMMSIHREMKADEAREAFRSDFASFRGENVIIPKTKHVDRGRGGSFDQAEYDEVCRRLSPALSRHGFGFRHDQKFGLKRIMTDGVENDVGWVWVTCHLEHRKGHAEHLELEGPPGDLSVNTPTQNMQTTASYLKRQSVLSITGTATGGEDDENKMRASNSAGPSPADQELLAGWVTFFSSATTRAALQACWNEACEKVPAEKPEQRPFYEAVRDAYLKKRDSLPEEAAPVAGGSKLKQPEGGSDDYRRLAGKIIAGKTAAALNTIGELVSLADVPEHEKGALMILWKQRMAELQGAK